MGVYLFNWLPLTYIKLDNKQKAAFQVYLEKVTKDDKWKEILKIRNPLGA